MTGSVCVCLYRSISTTAEPIWFSYTLDSAASHRFITIYGEGVLIFLLFLLKTKKKI